MHRCEHCDRVSYKSKTDLIKDTGWTFTVIFEQEVAVCGTCNGHPPPTPKKV